MLNSPSEAGRASAAAAAIRRPIVPISRRPTRRSERTLDHAYERGLTLGVILGLEALAGVAIASHRPDLGVTLWGKAQMLHDELGYPPPVFELGPFRTDLDSARAHLGAARFRELIEEGRHLRLEEALNYAHRA